MHTQISDIFYLISGAITFYPLPQEDRGNKFIMENIGEGKVIGGNIIF